jgi:hypothetical protein
VDFVRQDKTRQDKTRQDTRQEKTQDKTSEEGTKGEGKMGHHLKDIYIKKANVPDEAYLPPVYQKQMLPTSLYR